MTAEEPGALHGVSVMNRRRYDAAEDGNIKNETHKTS